MTDQDAMLKLARAVYPNAQNVWRDASELKLYVHEDCGAITQFDPANNDSQAVAVLCWLLKAQEFAKVGDAAVFFSDSMELFWHDGTPAGLRAAVTKAALRVVG